MPLLNTNNNIYDIILRNLINQYLIRIHIYTFYDKHYINVNNIFETISKLYFYKVI